MRSSTRISGAGLPALLNVMNLTAGYGRLPIISDVSVCADAGSLVAIIGPNGSGKSTLLKAVMGILKPMSGRVMLDQADVTGWPSYRIARQGVGYVPQITNVFPSLSVLENLEMGAFTLRGSSERKSERILDSFPDLANARRTRAGNLSGGQRNLLGVARALMAEPTLLLADEPTAGLAPDNTQRIWKWLIEIAAQGAAVIVVEQNVDLALDHADRAYVLVAGRNRLEGKTSDIRRTDLNALFLGGDPRSDVHQTAAEGTDGKR
jgi:branched-chain amino acid transport system ATP-binding protein